MRPERVPPQPGQESVWDYPRPPRVEANDQRVRVLHAGRVVADSRSALRVLETSQAPGFYLPPADVDLDLLVPTTMSSFCEWKGHATYWSVRAGDEVSTDAAWSYESPTAPFEAIRSFVAFYPSRVDECWVGEERALPNAGSFYGGWISSTVVGPFKGAAGTLGW